MKKTTLFVVFTAIIILFSSFKMTEKPSTSPSEDVERILEREMLNTIEYVEEYEAVDLGFDSYYYLPFNFNAYQGMEFELKDIEYVEFEEE